jgi:probable rRNA maturation factor
MPVAVSAPPELRGIARPLGRVVRAALALEGRRAGDVAVVIADDAALRALNRSWRGIDRATDVLSFPYSAAGAERIDGDLMISRDRLVAQARRFRVSVPRELARLVVHGALHLAGLDHHRAVERRHMRARERQAMAAVAEEIAAMERSAGRPWRAGSA